MKSPIVLFNEAFAYGKQVVQEGKKVVWPSRRDVVITSVMVCILAFMFAIFFFISDQLLNSGVQFLLGVK